MRITLNVVEGPHQGAVFTFVGHDTFLVGRSKKCHFQLPAKDKYFSRVHFMIEVNPPHCRLLDMESRNGTYVNRKRVEASTDLHPGDEIKAGRTVIRVSLEAGSQPEVVIPDVVPMQQPPVPLPPAVRSPTPPPGVTAPLPRPPAPRPTPLPSSPAARPPAPPPPKAAPPTPVVVGRSTPVPPAPHVPAVPVFAAEPPVVPVRVIGPAQVPTEVPARTVPHALSQVGPPQCRACGTLLYVTLPAPVPSLCPNCEDLARNHPQPVVGHRIVRELGRGGMGVVFLAVRQADMTAVALKTITPAGTASRKDIDRFLREAVILRDLQHLHIVRFYEMGEVEGRLHFTMEYVPGTDASRLLRAEGALAVGRAVTLTCQLLEALEYAHGQGFVHRDIKPANLLVSQEAGRELAKLTDFGLARVYQSSALSGLTLAGEMGGTLAFMAPEQVTHFREAKPPVDQYAAAATLYNLLTDRYIQDFPPKYQQGLLMVLHDEPVPIRSRRADIPKDLAAVIHRALAREPEDRYPDVRVLRRALLPFC